MENRFMFVVCLVNDIWSSQQRCQIYWKGSALKKSFSMKCVNILEILPVVKLCNSCISCKHIIITVNCILCRAFV